MGGLLLAEQCAGHTASGVVDCQQQRELRFPVLQPPVMTAVHLDQHPLPRHPLTAYPVPGWTMATRTDETRADQDTTKCGPVYSYALSLTEQLTQMGVVGAGMAGASRCTTSVITVRRWMDSDERVRPLLSVRMPPGCALCGARSLP